MHLVTNEDLRIVYGGYNEQSSIVIGNQSASEGLAAQLDMDKLISRHCAILGATGSGKSNAVSIVVKAIADKNFPSARVLMIALRMTNTRDKGRVSSAMQDELREMTEVLSSLRTGEAIVSGEAVRIPSRIKFYQADNAVKSSDPIASKLWANASPDVEEYETSVRNWRNQSFTQGGDNANP